MDRKSTISISGLMLEENFIRREKRRKLETQREIEKMRAELPVYDLNDIRQFKLPYHEALLLQLEETGYVHTEGYIKQLFDLQEQERKEAGPQSNIWNLPILKHSENELRRLSEALMTAEDLHKAGNYRSESETLLRVAIDFCFNFADWFWLGKQILMQCLSNSIAHKGTGKHEAIIRYIYAKVLIEKVKDFETAEEQLNITRKLSTGKSWNIKAFLPEQSDSATLFMNANYLLHLCYLRQARYFSKTDPQKCIEYAILAKKRANEACCHDGETAALLLKGQCELNLSDTKDAVATFNKAYYIQSRLKSEKGMCEARVELSKAYLMHGNTRFALQNLLELKQMAEEHGFKYYLAQAYRYLGEYYLNNGEPDKATPLLSDALHIFHEIDNMSEADQVRNLEALSAGLELMPDYITLIQKTDKRLRNWFDNLIKLVMWKDSRQPFWDDKKISKSAQGFESQTRPSLDNIMSTYFQRLSSFNRMDEIGFHPSFEIFTEVHMEEKLEDVPQEKEEEPVAQDSDILFDTDNEVVTEMYDLS